MPCGAGETLLQSPLDGPRTLENMCREFIECMNLAADTTDNDTFV